MRKIKKITVMRMKNMMTRMKKMKYQIILDQKILKNILTPTLIIVDQDQVLIIADQIKNIERI